MKNRAGKLIGILLLVMGLFLAAGCGSEAGESETQETEAQQERVTIYFFHNNPCESCHEGQKIRELAEKVMEGRENPIHYQTEEYYAFRTDGKQKLERLADELGIPDEDRSAAAPTAGLHFTTELLQELEQKGVDIAYVTLHVGLGTFRPVKVDNLKEHHMHSEYYQVTREAADKINKAKENGHRVVCVGTTSCRTVESACDENGHMEECCDNTEIFIYPGYRFKVLDALITNFHLPESTLVMLVSALAGREHVLAAYEEAVKEKYRFFSFGDAMLIK